MSFKKCLHNCFDYLEQNWKKSLMLIAVVFFIVWKSETLSNLTEKYLMSEANLSNWLLDVAVILIVLSGFILQYRLWLRDYKPSFYQSSVYLISVFAFSYFKNTHNNEWHFYEFTFFEFSYLEALLYSSIGFPGYCAYRSMANFFEENKANDSFPLIEDNPTLINETNNFKRQKLVERLIDVISKGQTEKAFSIGIIGPWGNGKSTILDTVYEHFASNDDIIKIKFHPFLNHNDQGVIDEFFKSFQQELRKYSGRLSNHVMDYAEELIRFYKRGDIKKVFESQQSVSAFSLYKKIEAELKQLDKKVVVFVDDLDRLNGVEILQVLKLIRNTANFPNTIFLVAVDKDYVINSLAKEKDYQSQRFVDKFFQLEIYLPPIQEEWLVEGFSQLIDECQSIHLDSKSEIKAALKNKYCLFPKYIKNMRDAKRLANQLIFEINFIDKGLDYTDYLNFLMFKMRFPKALQLINSHRTIFFKKTSDYYYLKFEKESQSLDELILNDEEDLDIDISQYPIVKNGKNKINNELELKELDYDLFTKTLLHLWGKYKNRNYFHSICYIRNFNKVMRLSFADSDLLPHERGKIFDSETFKINKSFIDGLFENGKTVQLIHLISTRKPNDHDQFVKVLQILSHCIGQIDEQDLSLEMIFYAIDNWIDPNYLHSINLDADSLKPIISEHIFNNVNVYPEQRFEMLKMLMSNRTLLVLWGYNGNDIINLALGIFEEKVKSSTIFDQPQYNMFVDTYNLTFTNNALLSLFLEKIRWVLKDSDLESFCHYLVEQANNPYKYRLSDMGIQLFNTDIKFFEFLRQHKDSETLAMREVLLFLELLLIIGKEEVLLYSFKSFIPQPNSYPFNIEMYNEYRDKRQEFFVEFENLKLYQNILDYANEKDMNYKNVEAYSKSFKTDKKFCLFFSCEGKQIQFKDLNDWIKEVYESFTQVKFERQSQEIQNLLIALDFTSQYELNDVLTPGPIVLKEGVPIISLKSIQPAM